MSFFDLPLLDSIKTGIAAAVVWVGGESGRIVVAGGAGGLARWFQSEKRRIRDGVLAAFGGALSATYLWPVPLHLIGVVTGPLDVTPENTAMAAFLTGAMGMSLVKVMTAMIEARAKKGGEDA